MRQGLLLIPVILGLCATAHAAPDGAALYKEHCAACHDSAKDRTPPLSAIKAMSAEAIYTALSNGKMQSQSQGLSTLPGDGSSGPRNP